jgi:hypothetical protein
MARESRADGPGAEEKMIFRGAGSFFPEERSGAPLRPDNGRFARLPSGI